MRLLRREPAYIRLLVVSIFLAGPVTALQAQQLVFDKDTAYSNSGSVVQLSATLTNHQQQSQTYRLSIQPGPVRLVSNLPATVTLEPGGSHLVLLKIYVPRRADAGMPYPVTLSAQAGLQTIRATAVIRLHPQKLVYLTALKQDIYLNPGNDTVRTQLLVRNAGNTAQPVEVLVRDPLSGKQLLAATVTLAGFSDTLLQPALRLSARQLQQSACQLLITGQYPTGDVFSTIQVNVYTTNSRKRYYADPRSDLRYDNMLAFYARFIGTDMQYYELMGAGGFNAGPHRVGYQLDALYYPALKGQGLLLMNTYVDYLTNRWNLRLGNIYRNDELLLAGRGIGVQLTPTATEKWEMGYVNGDYNLLGKFDAPYFKRSHTVFAGYTARPSGNLALKGSLFQQWDPDYAGNSTLGGGQVTFDIRPHHRVTAGAYGSYHTPGAYSAKEAGKWGMAGLLSYSGSFRKWQLVSNNYLSTRTYAGFQKGAVNLEERAGYTPHQALNLWARYSRISSRPEYISPVYDLFSPRYLVETAELGMNYYFRNGLYLTARPYYNYERSKNDFLNSAFEYAIRAAHLNAVLYYSITGKQTVFLNADAGWSHANLPVYRNYFAWKVMAGYQYRQFGLNTTLQNGPYYTGELALYPYAGSKFQLFIINPSFNGYLFRQRLLLNIANFTAYENSYRRWSNNLTVSATYYLKHQFALEASFNQLQYLGWGPQINGFDMGVVKKFSSHRQAKQYSLKVHFFEDVNGNRRPDPPERPVSGLLVRIGQDIFSTDADGTIVYKGLPGGHYRISVLQAGGGITADSSVYVSGRTELHIPLHKIGILKGRVVLKRRAYSYHTDEAVAGIDITAVDKTGKAFAVKTDEKGGFLLYLPLNTYSLQLNVATLPEKYTAPAPVQEIDLNRRPEQSVTFDVAIEERPVHIKKFQSPSMQR